jgi:phospholipase/carboxylesterase
VTQADDGRIAVRFEATGYLRLRVPDRPAAGAAPAVVAVHGYGQPSAEILEWVAGVAPEGTVVVAPEGPSAWYRQPGAPGGAAKGGVGHSWAADPRRDDSDRRNDALILAAVEAARERAPIDPARTVLLGYSQGVGVAAHVLASSPDLARGLVGLAGGVPLASRPRLSALAGKPVLWVTGTWDRAYPVAYAEGMVEALGRAGAAVEAAALDAGHALLDAAREPVAAWLARVLRAEGP